MEREKDAKKWFNKLIFKKYRIKKLLFYSNYSFIFDGIHEQKGNSVIIKIEDNKFGQKLLASEVSFLLLLKGFGIPKILGFGYSSSYPVLIEEKLGSSFLDIAKKRKLNLKDVCMFAVQALERIEYVHSKGIIHKDIGPSNFIIGKERPEIIYLIDFGLSHRYRSSRTGKHLAQKWKKRVFGNLRFKSISASKGYEESRRDDLESLGYTIIFLIKKCLPWDKILFSNETARVKAKALYKKKESIQTKDLCKGLPEEIENYIDYCKKLNFEETPDYEGMKFFFLTILIKNQFQNDLKFSYLDKAYLSKFEVQNRRITSISKKKKNLFERIINDHRLSLSKEKNVYPKEDLCISSDKLSNKKNNLNIITSPTVSKEKIILASQSFNNIDKVKKTMKKNNKKVVKELGKYNLKYITIKDSKEKNIGYIKGLNSSQSLNLINFPKTIIINQSNNNIIRKKVNIYDENVYNNNYTNTNKNNQGKFIYKGILVKGLITDRKKIGFISKGKNELSTKLLRQKMNNKKNIFSTKRIDELNDLNYNPPKFRRYIPQTLSAGNNIGFI